MFYSDDSTKNDSANYDSTKDDSKIDNSSKDNSTEYEQGGMLYKYFMLFLI